MRVRGYLMEFSQQRFVNQTDIVKKQSFNKAILPTALTIAVSVALVGCGGGGGGGASTPPSVTQPPVSGQPDNGGGDTVVPEKPNDEVKPTTPSYDAQKYNVTEPDTSGNLVSVGVLDTGVAANSYLKNSVEKVFRYIKDYESGELSIEDLTNLGIYQQDIDPGMHGTIVAQIITGQITNPIGDELNMKEGIAKDIARIYGVSTSDKNEGIGFTSSAYLAALDLNEKYGVKLFNGSFGTRDSDPSYINELRQYAVRLADGGSLVVMATGNEAMAKPLDETLLPVGNSAIENGWLAVTGLNEDHTDLFKNGNTGANHCGAAARWCLAADYINGPLMSADKRLVMFYGTSGATPQVTATAALLWSKFPWMTNDQIRQVLLTTADYIDDGTGLGQRYNAKFGWGALDIDGALKGPQSFMKIFDENFNANVTSDLAVFGNDIDGDAGLVKSGSGTLALTGDSTYTGKSVVDAGKLQVVGSIASKVDVNQSGILSGRGSVGAVQNNGTVSTKDGRLTVNGSYVQGEKGVLDYELNNHLTVNGEANLNGLLKVGAKDKTLVTKGDHLVVDADSVVGGFAKTESTSLFLSVNGLKTADGKVSVGVDFADAAKVGTVQGGISSASGELTNKLMDKANKQAENGESSKLLDYAVNVQGIANAEAAQSVLNSNSGALFGETPSVLLRNDTLAIAQITQRTHQATKRGVTGVWASTAYMENESKAAGWDNVDSEIFTATVGADFKVGQNGLIGAYVADYTEDNNYDASNGSSEVLLTTMGIYGKWTNPSDLFYVTALAQYGLGDVEFNRNVTDGTAFERAVAESDLSKFGLYGEVGYNFSFNRFDIAPYLAVSHNKVSMDAVRESSDIGVNVDDLTAKENKLHVGIRFDYLLSKQWSVGGYTEYAYAFDRSLPKVSLKSNLDNDVAVEYQSPSFDKDLMLYGVGFNYLTTNNKWNVFGDVAGNALNNGDYQAQLGFKYVF